LIIAFGIAGILSVLLVHPIRAMEGNRWIKTFSRWFYILLLPLVALMFVAIGTRIGDYGFTEERVFVMALAIWLAAIAVYYLLSPGGDIRVIPVTLALLALLLSAGPLSAFEISKRSQKKRLAHLLEKNGLVKDRRAIKARPGQQISFADRKGISSAVQYLLEHHGNESVKPYFRTKNLKAERWSSWNNTEILMKSINLDFIPPHLTAPAQEARWAEFSSGAKAVGITGYDVCIPIGGRHRPHPIDTGLHIRLADSNGFVVYKGTIPISPVISPASVFARLVKEYPFNTQPGAVPPSGMQQIVQGSGCGLLVFYHQLQGNTATGHQPEYYEGMVFLKWE
jgi:hypothetical protein